MRLRRWACMCLIGAGFLLAGPMSSQAEVTDRVVFGDRTSESAHGFNGQNSEVFRADEADAKTYDGPHIKAVTATSGTPPQNTLLEEGEWNVDGKREWIEYALSERIKLDRVTVNWGGGNHYFFAIKTSKNGQTWQTVKTGRNDSGRGTYRFDPVQTRYVRLVSGGCDRWWRPWVFRVAGVRIGELAYPQAYEPALAYEPGLGEACRRLMPGTNDESQDNEDRHAWLDFTVETEPDQQNYLTVKLWGSDARGINLRVLDQAGNAIDGKASDWQHLLGYGAAGLGAFRSFNGGGAGGGFPGRFIYVTYPIPRERTRGKEELTVRLAAAPGAEAPSQGIYAAYAHTDTFFTPPDDEVHGEPFEWGPAAGTDRRRKTGRA